MSTFGSFITEFNEDGFLGGGFDFGTGFYFDGGDDEEVFEGHLLVPL